MKRYLLVFVLLGLVLFGCTNSNSQGESTTGETDIGSVEDQTSQVQVSEEDDSGQDTSLVDETENDNPPEISEEDISQDEQIEEDSNVEEEFESDELGEDHVSTGHEVLIMGRSVAYGWMEYLGFEWQCDDEECVTGSPRGTYGGYDFIYYGLEYPPDIADSAIRGVDQYGQDAEVVFFKLCFADFGADDSGELARTNFGYVEDVYDAVVVQRGKKLIVGNALPMVSADTEPALVSTHRQYNQLVSDFAATHDNIQVLDLYRMLSDSSGALRSDYALSSDDSHLNSRAYDVITPEFMQLLEEN